MGRQAVRITLDTNVLVRALMNDHPEQSRAAHKALKEAASLALTLSCLCELVWVLRRLYRRSAGDSALAIRELLSLSKVATNRPAVEAGLAMLERGGDFADGVIAHEGQWLGAGQFVSFDRQAVELLREQGTEAVLL